MSNSEFLIIEEGTICLSPSQESLLKNAARTCLDKEQVPAPCAAGLTIVSDDDIQALNLTYRQKNTATDVLSFPTIAFDAGQTARTAEKKLRNEWVAELNACYLGDIIISFQHAEKQARLYGHSLERELCYLLVHGLHHLMGYDHMNEKDKLAMRKAEENVLNAIGITRLPQNEMLNKAREAMEYAYVPYSHYKVGACLLTEDGHMYTGCNVENASYGLTNCAERTAVFKAVSEGHRKFQAIAIAAEKAPPWPCGACRQVLSEFCADIPVFITWDGHTDQSTLKELLPHSFSPASGIQNILGKENA